MVEEGWQSKHTLKITKLLRSYPAVRAVLQYGSTVPPQVSLDRWSDVDLLIVADVPTVEALTSDVEWTASLGSLHAWEVFPSEFKIVLRLCVRDFSRFDLVFTTSDYLSQIDVWGQSQLSAPVKILLCRDPLLLPWLTTRLEPSIPVGPSATEFGDMVRRFWFGMSVAITKVVRNDLLIALHLSQEALQTCLVLKMILRDREMGTSHHRTGGSGNRLVMMLNSMRDTAYDSQGLLDRLTFTADLFDALATDWDSGYVPRSETVLLWIEIARSECRSDPREFERAPEL